jgi:hypothetical protein
MDAVLNWSPVVSHYSSCIGSSGTNSSNSSNANDIMLLCKSLHGLRMSLEALGRGGEHQQGGRVRSLMSRLLCRSKPPQ